MKGTKIEAILQKMVKYAELSKKYMAEVSYEEFASNEMLVTFVVFNLSQLGELVTKLDKGYRDRHPIINWNELKGLRNRIVHDYEGVNYRIVYRLVTGDAVDQLIEDLRGLMA